MLFCRKEHWKVETTCSGKLKPVPISGFLVEENLTGAFHLGKWGDLSTLMASDQNFKIQIMDFVLRKEISFRNIV